MCGRFRLKDPRKAYDWLEVEPSFEFKPRYNIAPTQPVAVVTGHVKIEEMRWGITGSWRREGSRPLINARAESVREKGSFKESFARRRCLAPADGFYEWTKTGKQPYLFTLKDEEPFALGGFWETTGEVARCCLLTTEANSVLEPIHDRMPVIVRREDWPEWFAPGELDDGVFQRIVAPYPAGEMLALAVSNLVNSAGVDDPRCCAAAGPVKPEGQQTFGF